MTDGKEILQIPATITKFETMAHGSFKIIIHSQENVKEEPMFKLMKLKDRLGWLSFVVREKDGKEYQVDAEDILNLPELDESQFDLKKSPSKRLRDVLFIQHSKQGGKKEDFDMWYVRKMNRIIEFEKDKIDN
jgi:hypothetical protein